MTGERLCSCGFCLEEAGERLPCPGCGAEARAWAARLDRAAVAAATAYKLDVALPPPPRSRLESPRPHERD